MRDAAHARAPRSQPHRGRAAPRSASKSDSAVHSASAGQTIELQQHGGLAAAVVLDGADHQAAGDERPSSPA